MQLIHVGARLREIDKPFEADWHKFVRRACFLVCCLAFIGGTSFPYLAVMIAGLMVALLFGALSVVEELYLPASARRFLWRTRKERAELDRRARKLNRVWCLATRNRKLLPHPAGVDDPWQAHYEKLNAEIEAYAARYSAAVAGDLRKIAESGDRTAARRLVEEQSKDLCELEKSIEDLGAEATPGMRQQADTIRSELEEQCKRFGLSVGLVRHARLKPPHRLALPPARVVKGG